jgi:hypothetical protein
LLGDSALPGVGESLDESCLVKIVELAASGTIGEVVDDNSKSRSRTQASERCEPVVAVESDS